MSDASNDSRNPPSDDMSAYLQMFLDETEEQLDDLVETLLLLERDPDNANELNEAFRLIHSIKGSAGLMGFDNITALTHRLENRFESFRSGRDHLDQPTMNVVLRCIDFLRDCNERLRDGQQLGASESLLEELRELEEQAEATEPNVPREGDESQSPNSNSTEFVEIDVTSLESEDTTVDEVESLELASSEDAGSEDSQFHFVVAVRFEPDLPLADLKARLIITRLSELGEIQGTKPSNDELESLESLSEVELRIITRRDIDELRAAANIDGVQSVDVQSSDRSADDGNDRKPTENAADDNEETAPSTAAVVSDRGGEAGLESNELLSAAADHRNLDAERLAAESSPFDDTGVSTDVEPSPVAPRVEATERPAASTPALPETSSQPKVAKTMRVDIDRLDNLMNLTGQLVVNRARFVQISSEIRPALQRSRLTNRADDLSSEIRRTLDHLHDLKSNDPELRSRIHELAGGLQRMEEQSQVWNTSLRCLGQITDAIDQLTRVSDSLQQGVLDTRMVPIGPLFSRFKRVVRDLSVERNKKIRLQIRGEKTELDKRMVDELGDPLVHLVRNSIDHGMESPEVRLQRGKSEIGTVILEASHGGNNVYIRIQDDGGGIDTDKIKNRIVDHGLLSPEEAGGLSEDQLVDFIWHPGFSTAREVTNISGRGVGMDVVKTRIQELSGSVDVQSTHEVGTTFTIRLPLTLAIMNSLLVRVQGVIFAIPIDDVREIVSLKPDEVVSIRSRHTFEVRGEYLPLISIDSTFHWHDVDYGHDEPVAETLDDESDSPVTVVILHSGGRTMGLRVDDLLGSQDIVIKSLSDNFRDIPGLSGASILGDGTVCLMLDVATAMRMAVSAKQSIPGEVHVGTTR